MATYLCIIHPRASRLLTGYIDLVLDQYARAGDDVTVIVDRRQPGGAEIDVVAGGTAGPRPERRRRTDAELELQEQGYTIVRVGDSLADVPRLRRRALAAARATPPWRAALVGIAVVALVVSAVVPWRSAGGALGDLALDAGDWI